MDYFQRLVRAGVDTESALDTIYWYRQQGDDIGLERYTQAIEELNKRIEEDS